MSELEEAGQTTMVVRREGSWLGVLGVADTVRSGAHEVVQALKRSGIQRAVMLSGDNARVARSIASRVGLDEARAPLMPADKVTAVQELGREHTVAMVGDGVNDAPALAAAAVGVAMGGAGSDAALETADVVLMSDDLSRLPFAVGLARAATAVMKQNLVISLGVSARAHPRRGAGHREDQPGGGAPRGQHAPGGGQRPAAVALPARGVHGRSSPGRRAQPARGWVAPPSLLDFPQSVNPCSRIVFPRWSRHVLGRARRGRGRPRQEGFPRRWRFNVGRDVLGECMTQGWKKLVLCLVAVGVLVPGVGFAAGLKIALQADDGTWFSRCNGCQKSVDNKIPDTITTHVKENTGAFSQFELVDAGGGKIALKSDTGKFVGRCNGCIVKGAQPDVATVHVGDAAPAYAQFTLETLSNGKYALKADTGKYLARCNGCSPESTVPNTVTVHATNPEKEAFAQWNIVPIFPKGSKVTLQGDEGQYFARCNGCQKSVDNKIPDTITTHEKSPKAAYAQFEVVDAGGGKIALKSDTGKFVGRCNGCIVKGAQPDVATVHVGDATPAYAQFKPVLLNNGKWGLQADTGKYLARCNACSPGSTVPNTVTVHATAPTRKPSPSGPSPSRPERTA